MARLSAAGARVEPLAAPEVSEALGLAATLSAAEAYGRWRDLIEANPDAMFPRILERFRGGATVQAAEFVASWLRLDAARLAWADGVAAADAVILPTAPILPPDAERLMTDEAYYVAENLLALRNTRIASLLGLCAITLPAGEPSCGIMLMGPAGARGGCCVWLPPRSARWADGQRAKRSQFSARAPRPCGVFSGPAGNSGYRACKRGDTTPVMRQ